ncbi:hypothetical protein SGUI_1597 [Serinicoccus hydrothermalis]|uniref:VOC domain-containing protein n=1 Tax=Serinicoccus hydrothermalis TaxID=1758689 RepID=A0A1B1NC35_9MICO|nr:VOC family protein [Serinicoccus hydrothermalis]ANS78993.1 hypothetical protein SGUI_1597 [Serinicoccus hydrothermalis]
MLSVHMVTIDCDDLKPMVEFWTQALRTEVAFDWDDFVVLKGEPAIGLQRVDEVSPGKNRIHLDLSGGERAPEVARLVELGADVVRTHDVDDFGWTVMVDPAGNEFCVSDPHGTGEGEDAEEPEHKEPESKAEEEREAAGDAAAAQAADDQAAADER